MEDKESGTIEKGGMASVGAVVLAFLASQHHILGMLVIGLGMGGAAMSHMTMVPVIRRVMMLMSLAMIGVIVYQVRNPKRPIALRLLGGVSILVTLGLLVWSVRQSGF